MAEPRRDSARGFTLLEILIVLVIFGLIMVGLTSGLRFAGRAWSSQQRLIDRAGDFDAVQNTLREIIQSGRDFKGSAGALQFEGPLPRALGRAGAFDLALKTVDDELVLTWQPHVKNPDPDDAGRATLLDGISGLTLSYFILADRAPGVWGASAAPPKAPGLIQIGVDLGTNRIWPPLVVAPNIENLSAK
jgi:general secretion pathway protein J